MVYSTCAASPAGGDRRRDGNLRINHLVSTLKHVTYLEPATKDIKFDSPGKLPVPEDVTKFNF